MQPEFTTSLFDADRLPPKVVAEAQSTSSRARFGIYRNNVIVSLCDALEATFPRTRAAIGATNFRNIARVFVTETPPTSPLMFHYGDTFPAFLAQFPPLKKLGYPQDLARIEYLMCQSYHAAEHDRPDWEAISQISDTEFLNSTCLLGPEVFVVSSPYPIFDLWRVSKTGGPPPRPEAQSALVVRPEFDPIVLQIPNEMARAIVLLKSGHSFGETQARLNQETDQFDITETVGKLAMYNCFIQIGAL